MPLTEIDKPVYIALGNSITHGVGQESASFLTYPYILAEKLNYDMYNLGVGGAKISFPLAQMTKEMPKAKLITILIGYNDFKFKHKTIQQFIHDYTKFINELRKNQPNANIFCIGLTYTKATINEHSGVKPEDYRIALKNIIYEFQTKGDQSIFYIAGDEITSEEDLNDKVHLNIQGAANFANKLYNQISIIINN